MQKFDPVRVENLLNKINHFVECLSSCSNNESKSSKSAAYQTLEKWYSNMVNKLKETYLKKRDEIDRLNRKLNEEYHTDLISCKTSLQNIQDRIKKTSNSNVDAIEQQVSSLQNQIDSLKKRPTLDIKTNLIPSMDDLILVSLPLRKKTAQDYLLKSEPIFAENIPSGTSMAASNTHLLLASDDGEIAIFDMYGKRQSMIWKTLVEQYYSIHESNSKYLSEEDRPTDTTWSSYLQSFLILSRNSLFTFDIDTTIRITEKISLPAYSVEQITCYCNHLFLCYSTGTSQLIQKRQLPWQMDQHTSWPKKKICSSHDDWIKSIETNGKYLAMSIRNVEREWRVEIRSMNMELVQVILCTNIQRCCELTADCYGGFVAFEWDGTNCISIKKDGSHLMKTFQKKIKNIIYFDTKYVTLRTNQQILLYQTAK
ncbi:unnamed protein product [Didymodactylos carnosus]|uniref:Uncharacterized protein n=1 Tax=Didymodactylos carnosus TaxID=1234261 RepID=A0A814FQ41_9BILA|nr:unnamed protein product [Didymodactylos carnosus]CAF1023633.1 unnamed protein product [Didymodactylos carnosus]CAF3758282.1 unnamed protein product [Didymodactylos carnosus]CAF3792128.1 unnamed protein product [Didymodactylos carnosus]